MCASETSRPEDDGDRRAAYLASAIALFGALLERQTHSAEPEDPQLAALLREAARALLERACCAAAQWAELLGDPQAAALADEAPEPPAPAVDESAAGVAMAVDYLRSMERHLRRRR